MRHVVLVLDPDQDVQVAEQRLGEALTAQRTSTHWAPSAATEPLRPWDGGHRAGPPVPYA
jgi:hypothetical protein